MVRFALVLFAGCGFHGPGLLGVTSGDDGGIDSHVTAPDGDVPTIDAGLGDANLPTIDAPIAVDAHLDAPVTLVYDSLTIPGTGGVVTSTFVPAAGVTYHLRASGFVQVATGISSDAEYWGFPGQANDLTSDGTVDMGLGIDDPTLDTIKTKWGAYTSTHIYVITYVGTGAALHAQYEDNFFGNNSGTMTLEIMP